MDETGYLDMLAQEAMDFVHAVDKARGYKAGTRPSRAEVLLAAQVLASDDIGYRLKQTAEVSDEQRNAR